jgi:two-component sensor histidine kinase
MEVEELKHKNAEQKEILLREIHHRVKNNLSIVISLLGMQVRESNNAEFKRLSEDIELRIRSMALIHEHLYKSDQLDRIPFDNYIQSLASIISMTYSGNNVKLKTKFDPAVVKIESAMPLGLIVNEVLTNAFKYAFPDQRPGIILLEIKAIKPQEGLYHLMIKDNGVGLPDTFNIHTQNSLGMSIIRLLAKQIEAELTIKNHHGTSFDIVFKAISNDDQA